MKRLIASDPRADADRRRKADLVQAVVHLHADALDLKQLGPQRDQQRQREVEVWRRDDTGAWSATTYGPDADVVLDSVALTLPMDLIYEDSGL